MSVSMQRTKQKMIDIVTYEWSYDGCIGRKELVSNQIFEI